jgi:hypothetical protein
MKKLVYTAALVSASLFGQVLQDRFPRDPIVALAHPDYDSAMPELKQVQDYLYDAQKRYQLQDWNISVHVVSAKEVGYYEKTDKLPNGRLASSSIDDFVKKKAEIWIMRQADWKKLEEGDPVENQFVSVNHELCHILISSGHSEGLIQLLDRLTKGKKVVIKEYKY